MEAGTFKLKAHSFEFFQIKNGLLTQPVSEVQILSQNNVWLARCKKKSFS